MIGLGMNLATAFSLPKSVGAIFGLLFASPRPLALDDCVERLEISKGSASNGLKFLQRMGAIRPVFSASERRTLYEPEVSLRRLLIGVLKENVMPHLQQSREQVANLRSLLGNFPEEEREILEDRLDAIETWDKKSRLLMPLLERFLSAPLKGKR